MIRVLRSLPTAGVILCLGVTATLWVGAAVAACGEGDGGGKPEPLARVNGRPVTQAQVDDVRAEARLAGEQKDADDALDEAIGRELVRQEAERLGLVVDEAEVNERLAAVAERVGGEEALAQALEKAGMSAGGLRRGAAYGLLREKVRDERFGDVTVSDTAVRAFYRRHRDGLFTRAAAVDLESILVRTDRLAQKLVDDLRAGKRFSDLAKTYTLDPASKQQGGRLGWVTASSLPDPLRRAVEGMKDGEVAGPVAGPGGWYVLRLRGRRPARVTPFADVEADLRAELEMRARTRALDRWIAAERKRADVVLASP